MDWKLFWYGVLFLMMLNGYLNTKKEDNDNANAFVIMFIKFIYFAGSAFSLYFLIIYLKG